MKLEFVEKVKKLSNESLVKMVEKIQELKASTISELDQDKIKINVEEFDGLAFQQISNFVDELASGELPSKRQKTQP